MPHFARRARTALVLAAACAGGPVFAQYSTPMRDVENPDRSPFMLQQSFTITSPFVNNFIYFPTTAGLRYFIDQVSMNCVTSSATDTMTTVSLLLGQNNPSGAGYNTYAASVLPLTRRGPGVGSGAVWSGAAMVNVFSDGVLNNSGGAMPIGFNAYHVEYQNSVSCNAFVSGHTLAVP